MLSRSVLVDRLVQQRFEVLVIGGGVVGSAIARDAAMRGLSVALVEQGDFAGGTSSKTSKLIHGGLRYLEQGRVHLVSESLRERATWQAIAPDLVTPISLLLPLYADGTRPAWKIRAGLELYRWLSKEKSRAYGLLSSSEALRREAGLAVEGLQAAGLFSDCQMDDARLCLRQVLQAIQFGGVCVNYTRVKQLLQANDIVSGAAVEDIWTGRAFEIEAACVVNAAGPWADDIRRMSRLHAPTRLAPTKGIHLIVPKIADHGLFVESRHDKRLIFILPWRGFSLIGTTESPVEGALDMLKPHESEMTYLLEIVHEALPQVELSERDIIAAYAGARPLLSYGGAANTASREHLIEVDPHGLMSVLGGKYTTARLMAEQAVDIMVRRLGRSSERCVSHRVALVEDLIPNSLEMWAPIVDRLTPQTLGRMMTRYGVGLLRILELIDKDPTLAQPACAHHPELAAELVYGIREEMACSVTDVLARRTLLAWSPCHGLEILPKLTEWLVQYSGFSTEVVAKQVDAYSHYLARAKAFHPAWKTTSIVGSVMEGLLAGN